MIWIEKVIVNSTHSKTWRQAPEGCIFYMLNWACITHGNHLHNTPMYRAARNETIDVPPCQSILTNPHKCLTDSNNNEKLNKIMHKDQKLYKWHTHRKLLTPMDGHPRRGNWTAMCLPDWNPCQRLPWILASMASASQFDVVSKMECQKNKKFSKTNNHGN